MIKAILSIIALYAAGAAAQQTTPAPDVLSFGGIAWYWYAVMAAVIFVLCVIYVFFAPRGNGK